MRHSFYTANNLKFDYKDYQLVKVDYDNYRALIMTRTLTFENNEVKAAPFKCLVVLPVKRLLNRDQIKKLKWIERQKRKGIKAIENIDIDMYKKNFIAASVAAKERLKT